ncbi:MAG: hypothetical protein PVF05_13490, partial [Gemmatimonadales bacterium]
GGRLAAVGQRLVESSAKAIIKQSLDGLNEAVKARAGAASGGGGGGGGASASGQNADAPDGLDTSPSSGAPATPTPTPKKPSQAKFAANVAREVARDIIPAPVRIGLAIVAVAALLYVLYLLFLG